VGDAGCAEGVWSIDSAVRVSIRTQLHLNYIIHNVRHLTRYSPLANELDQRHPLRGVEGFASVHDSR